MSFNQNEKDLTLLYDEDFNIKYDIVSKMNKAISAKSKVIEITDAENHKQRKKINWTGYSFDKKTIWKRGLNEHWQD